ncbi:MAG: hypothetical protein VX563_00950, partial [Planctomycetota bacterium]|nr:hypothetical protein [Planctomycetota bacterium]
TMRSYRLRSDLQRSDAGGFLLPLGVEASSLPRPVVGYTLEYTPTDDDQEDAYAFHVVVSHEQVRAVVHAAFSRLPDEVYPVIEVGSRDAYRSIDVFTAVGPIAKRDFLELWAGFEPFLLEDATIGAGASADDPLIEVFLDPWKGISINVPVSQRESVETMLVGLGLRETPETWPLEIEREVMKASRVRDVLEIIDEHSPDLDELLLQMREGWGLELDVDREENVDEGGRSLGFTLWHSIIVVEPADGSEHRGAYISIWSTGTSIGQVEELISETLAGMPEWSFQSIYSIDRVAYDERPEELSDLPPRRAQANVHQISIDVWGDETPPDAPSGTDGDGPRAPSPPPPPESPE